MGVGTKVDGGVQVLRVDEGDYVWGTTRDLRHVSRASVGLRVTFDVFRRE